MECPGDQPPQQLLPLGYGDADGSVVININDDEDFESLKEEFESVERHGSTYHPHAMPYENHLTIFICRKMRRLC